MSDSDNESGGQNARREGSSARQQDMFLPIANVSGIMRKALPANAEISDDAQRTVQECVSEVISFITSEASDKCKRENRETINGDDLIWAMTTLGFEDFVGPLQMYLNKYREMESGQGTLPETCTLNQIASEFYNYDDEDLYVRFPLKKVAGMTMDWFADDPILVFAEKFEDRETTANEWAKLPFKMLSNKRGRTNKRGRMELMRKCSLLGWRRWEDLNPNLLREIFSRVPVHDLLLNVSSVCLSWELVCWDFLFWSRNVFDLSATDARFDVIDSHTLLSFYLDGIPGLFRTAEKLERLLQRVLEPNDVYGCSLQNWRLSIHTVIIPFEDVISDSQLVYLAERLPCVKHLSLLGASRVTVEGLTKAIQIWKQVKEIFLVQLHEPEMMIKFIEEMGRSCTELEFLHMFPLNSRADSANSRLIARSLPRLKRIEFITCSIYTRGVAILLEACPRLEEMHFYWCYMAGRDASYTYRNFGMVKDLALSWSVGSDGYVEWHMRTAEADTRLEAEFDSWMLVWEQRLRLGLPPHCT